MRQTYKCLECGGVLRLCSRFESEGVECWHCDVCPAKVSHSRAGELGLLGSAVFPLQKALDTLQATQVRQGTLGLAEEIKYVLSNIERTRVVLVEVLKRLDVPLIQEVPDQRLSYNRRMIAELNKKTDKLSLEEE